MCNRSVCVYTPSVPAVASKRQWSQCIYTCCSGEYTVYVVVVRMKHPVDLHIPSKPITSLPLDREDSEKL